MAIDHPDLSRARDPSTPAEVLTRLAAAVVDRLASTPRTEYEIQLRAAIAANANTPLALLARLAIEHTAEVVHNPALMFVLVEDANALTTVFKDALLRLLAHPDIPLDWLHHAARDKQPWVRRAAARAPSVPAEAQGILVNDPDPWVLLDLATNPRLSPHFLAVLALREPPPGKAVSPLQRAVAANRSTPVHTLERLAEIDNLLTIVAANPSLPAYLFESLTAHEDPLVRAAVASQPDLARALQRKLGLDPDRLVLTALAAACADPELLDQLSLSPEGSVRKAVIGNPRAPTLLLRRLLYSPNSPHRAAAEAALKARSAAQPPSPLPSSP